MALKDDLIGVWCEDSSPGTDMHTNNLTLTDVNTVGTASGKVGTAGDFEASNVESLYREDEALLSAGDIAIHLAAWVRLESLASTTIIVAKSSDVTSTSLGVHEYGLYYSTFSNRFVFRVLGGTTNTLVNADNFGAASTGTWYYVEGYHDPTANTINVRVNRGTANSASHSAGIGDGTNRFRIGADVNLPGNSRQMDGLVNQLAFWKAIKSDADMDAIYNSGNGLAFSSWDASGSTVRPRSLLTLGCGC